MKALVSCFKNKKNKRMDYFRSLLGENPVRQEKVGDIEFVKRKFRKSVNCLLPVPVGGRIIEIKCFN